MGKLDNGFRFVYPIFDQRKTHVGSVEVSISVNDFLKRLEDSFHSKVNLLINKKAVEDEVFKDAIKTLYTETLISPNYYKLKKDMGEYTPKGMPRSLIATIHTKIEQEIPFSVYFKSSNGQYQVISFLPIKNIEKNQTLGYVIKHSKNDYIGEMQNDYYIVLVMILFILAGITFYAYKDYKYKQNLTDNFKTIQAQKEELSQSVEELERQNVQIAQSIEENRKKDTMIAEQSRLASLGEMIGNIAHQWRQPLSAISTTASSIMVQNDLGILNQAELNPALGKIIEKTQFLSQTIEDFRNFIEGKKEKVEFVISSAIDNALSVVDSSIANHSIIIKKDYQDMIFITNFKNEFIQAILNIINNAKDALSDKIDQGDRYIFISVKKEEKYAVIIVQDNAGGIPNDVITKVFEPYFTTKHQSQGTGLGLYMTYKIIHESMKGSITVINNQFTYNDQTYIGAKFEIHLPINEIKEASNV
jgi:signal transduction histidine kinase